MASVASPPRPSARPRPPSVTASAASPSASVAPSIASAPCPRRSASASVWTLRKLDPHAAPATYSVAQAKGEPAGCTCPDHEQRGSVCKHIMALAALGPAAPAEGRPARQGPHPAGPCQECPPGHRRGEGIAGRGAAPPGGDRRRAARGLAARRRPPVVRRRLPPGRRCPHRPAERHGRGGSHLHHLCRLRRGIRAHRIGRLLRGLLAGRGCRCEQRRTDCLPPGRDPAPSGAGWPLRRFAAAQLERAAVLLHLTGAHSEAEFDARIAANEEWVKEESFERGYAEGRASALRSLNGYADAHLN